MLYYYSEVKTSLSHIRDFIGFGNAFTIGLLSTTIQYLGKQNAYSQSTLGSKKFEERYSFIDYLTSRIKCRAKYSICQNKLFMYEYKSWLNIDLMILIPTQVTANVTTDGWTVFPYILIIFY